MMVERERIGEMDIDRSYEGREIQLRLAMFDWANGAMPYPMAVNLLRDAASLKRFTDLIPEPSAEIDVADCAWLYIDRPDDQKRLSWINQCAPIEKMLRFDPEVKDCRMGLDGDGILIALLGDDYGVDDLARVDARLRIVIDYVVRMCEE